MNASPTRSSFGYHGRYLVVDVSTGRSRWQSLDERVRRGYLGGSGLGVRLLLEHEAATAEPLGAESTLAFVFSPLVGSPLTTSAKFAVVSRSPLTMRINDSLASSGFAISGKQTGADAILITGQAAEPSVLLIDNGEVRLEPAGDLWGLGCEATERRLAERFGPGFRAAVIGPAGERLVSYATISHDGRHAGRGGSGAVLGAKRIKAVLVRGDRRCEWAEPTALVALAKDISRRSFGPATAKYRELGTAANMLVFNRLNALPTRNFQQGSFAAAANLAPETLAVAREKTQASCVACTIGCEHIYSIGRREGSSNSSPSPAGGVRMEYENLFALGSLCGIEDADAVLAASRKCDDLGIDTISAGGTIALAMECVERGWLNAPWLRFGDGAALDRALDEIGSRAGIGDHLAEGSRRLAERIGPEALAIAPQVKGLELPGYEPRSLQTMALGFAVGSRGADHNRSGAYEADFSEHVDRHRMTAESVAAAILAEDKAALMDSMILCKFLRGVFADFYAESTEMLRLVTGWDVTADELRATARRIVTAKKQFNIAAGWTPAEDRLPTRFLSDALPEDGSRIAADELAAAIAEYNRQRGWTAEGYLPH
ncbi:MAG: aldehyde ferredoxin oxidoreductase family protein [Pirellulaceae bacterium]